MRLRASFSFMVSLLLLVPVLASAAEPEDTMFSYIKRFYFKVDRYNIDENMPGNAAAIDSILTKVRDVKKMNATNIRVHVIGSASLEATDEHNAKLAANRSHAMVQYLKRYAVMDGVDVHADDGVYDWTVLYNRVEHSECPCKEQLMEILRIPNRDISIGDRKKRIMNLGNGSAFEYIAPRYFSEMRYASIRITANMTNANVKKEVVRQQPEVVTVERVVEKPVLIREPKSHKGIIGIRTNGLYDAVAVPNLGIDMYVSKAVSVGVNWMYSWWNSDRIHRYWRTYGGDVHADYWFDPTLLWSGHHVGVYAQMGTYDFEWKGVGYQGPKWTWGGGLSYGYSVWLSNHFSLDFNLGLGYAQGKRYEYTPGLSSDKKYYLDKTKTMHWVGPTKLEVSLIWKLGKDY